MLVAAALCPAPPLLARQLTGTDPVLPDLRRACQAAVAALLAAGPGLIAIVGTAEVASEWDPDGRLDLAAFAPALAAPPPGTPALPPALGLGALLLEQAGYAGPRVVHSVTADDPAEACARLGKGLAGQADRVALLAMADGSARRSRRAPGYLDERAAGFDAAVERAVRAADLDALLAVDTGLARELMATGRPAWQVLAGAAAGTRMTSEIRYCDDPFGVCYLVASLSALARPPLVS